jgi:mannose-6-phosphate isomerase
MSSLSELLTAVNLFSDSMSADRGAHDIKLVRKHWGEERWLVAEGSPFGFKLITIRAGKRTSLQYHERKEETNLVLSGEGWLRTAPGPAAPLDEHPLAPGRVAHILPGVVHRIEAVTDIVDDVIRLEDDYGRGSGRIESEHVRS